MVVTACTSANKVVVSNAGGSICVGTAIRLPASATVNVVNVGDGDGEVYRDKTATTVSLRTITGIGGITVDTNGDVVRIDGTAVTGVPGGSDNQLQFNDSGVLGGADLYWDGTVLGFGGIAVTDSALKGVSTAIHARLGDDSDWCGLSVGTLDAWDLVDVHDNDMDNVNSIRFNLTPVDGVEEGRLLWDEVEKTLSVGMSGGAVNLQIGQEHLVRVKNTEAVQIDNGQVVRQSGNTAGTPNVVLADNANVLTSAIVGMATEDIAAGQFGYVTAEGKVNGLDTSSWPTMTPLWVGTNGDVTTVRPTAPTTASFVGQVIRQNNGAGNVYLRPTIVQRISWSSDCNILDTTLTDGDMISWDIANLRWDRVTLAGLGSSLAPSIDHGTLDATSLTHDDHSGHPWLLGRSGGQVLYGGTASGDDLTLHSTSHGTKGLIYFGANSAYDQVNDRMGIGTTAPASQLNIQGAAGTGVSVLIETTDNTKSTLASFSTQDSGTKGAWDVGAYASSHATKAGVFFVYQGADNAGSAVNLERLTISQAGLVGVGNLEIASAGVLGWAGSTQLSAPADGVLLLTDAAGTNFDRFQIGGTTSSFPSLNRNAAQLEAKLADDSAYTNFKAATFFAENGFFVSSASRITSPVDGDFLFTDAAGTNFSMLQFGGTTSSFPALNRNAAQLEAKLADSSVFADFKARTMFATTGFYIETSSRLTAPADGQWLMTDTAATSFGMLQFGGVTSSFPALKRSTTGLLLKLADDSGFTDLSVGELFAVTNVRAGSTGRFYFNARSEITSPSDGSLLFTDDAGTDFGRIQLGGTTSSFPALKRTSARFDLRLADDSGYTDLRLDDLIADGLVRWSSSTIMSASADGNLFLRDAAGTGFSLLQLGGTTSSFPAWKRVSAGLAARVADDTADADLSAKDVQVTGDLNHDGSGVGFYGTAPVAQSAAYTPSNVAADRAYDANATTIHELADVLGTLIADLQATGLLA